MANWISLEEAAWKYGTDEEDIRLWVEKKEIASSGIGDTYAVDDEEIQEFLNLYRTPPTRQYIRTIEELYRNASEICQLYAQVNEEQELRLQQKEEVISRMGKLQEIMENQNKHIKEILAATSESSAQPGGGMGVIRKLRKSLGL